MKLGPQYSVGQSAVYVAELPPCNLSLTLPLNNFWTFQGQTECVTNFYICVLFYFKINAEVEDSSWKSPEGLAARGQEFVFLDAFWYQNTIPDGPKLVQQQFRISPEVLQTHSGIPIPGKLFSQNSSGGVLVSISKQSFIRCQNHEWQSSGFSYIFRGQKRNLGRVNMCSELGQS